VVIAGDRDGRCDTTLVRWRVPVSGRSEAAAARGTREGRGERSESANREAGEV
jgi:hypothetical protein